MSCGETLAGNSGSIEWSLLGVIGSGVFFTNVARPRRCERVRDVSKPSIATESVGGGEFLGGKKHSIF